MDFVRRDAAAWAKRETGCRYAVVPNAGHVVNMDNPQAFNAALLTFLAEKLRQPRFLTALPRDEVRIPRLLEQRRPL